MACDETTEAADAAIEAALASPQSVSVDGQTVVSRSIRDLIEARKELRKNCVQSSGVFPIRLLQVKPPGAV